MSNEHRKVGRWRHAVALFKVFRAFVRQHRLSIVKSNLRRGYHPNPYEAIFISMNAAIARVKRDELGPETEARKALELKRKLGL